MSNTNENPKTLYYYCTLETFFKIIDNSKLWLTDISKSNDSLEQKFIVSELLKKSKMIIPQFYKETEFPEVENLFILALQLHLDSFYKNERIKSVWAICLSEKEDDLSQWRGYGDDARGICIGFNYEYLNIINDLNTDTSNDFVCLNKIFYGEDALKKYTEELSPKYPKNLGYNNGLEELKKHLKSLYIKPYYKMDAFNAESEWRIVYTSKNYDIDYDFEIKNNIKFKESFELSDLIFEVRNGYLQSHLELKIDLTKAIDKIIIGSKCKTSIEDIRKYLIHKKVISKEENALDIKNSESSYR